MILTSLLGAGLSFGTACATLAMMGLGVPMVVGALAASAAAGLVLHAALLQGIGRPMASLRRQADADRTASAALPAIREEMAAVETRAAALRHDLRGVLSPALMVTDRLLRHQDPAVQRAGQAVVRSVQRATELIQASKGGAATAPGAPPGPGAG